MQEMARKTQKMSPRERADRVLSGGDDDQNPFSNAYAHRVVSGIWQEPYGDVDKYRKNGGVIVVVKDPPIGRLDEYMNKSFMTGEGPKVPVMFIDGELWMSLTNMELQSQYLPIKRAQGRVGTGGLGLGFFTQQVCLKPDVRSVDVYEENHDVIVYFHERFKDEPWYKKVTIIEGDCRKKMVDNCYNFVYMDIYQTLLPDSAIIDIRHFTENNEIGLYHWWGWEKVLYAGLHEFEPMLKKDEEEFFKLFYRSGKHRLADDHIDDDYIEEALDAMGRL